MTEEENQKTSPKILLLLIPLVLLSIFSYWYFNIKTTKDYSDLNKTQIENTKDKFADLDQDVDTKEIPGEIPKDLPIEMSAPVSRNKLLYFSKTEEIHSARTYESSKSVEAIKKSFSDYLKKNKWEILLDNTNANSFILISRDPEKEGTISMTASKSSVSEKNIVDIVFITKNKI